jgi:galactonate dehydratase
LGIVPPALDVTPINRQRPSKDKGKTEMAQEHDKVVRLQAHVAEVTSKTRWIFVQVTTASGLIGAGEGSLNNQEAAVLQALRGRSASLFALPHAVPTAWPKPQGLVEAAAVSALDQALWDITAQRSGQSMAAALGGVRRSSIPLYANINRRTLDRNPAGFAASARDALAAGFEAVKIAPFDEVAPGPVRVPGALGPGLARIAATREAIGPTRDLMVDCHWRLDEREAETVIREGEALGLYWVECPLPETEANLPALSRLRKLANVRAIRLAGCETAVGEEGFAPFLRAQTYDAMMPDAKYVGGLAKMLRIAETFAEVGVAFSLHNPTGPVCHAASLQVCAAAGTLDRLEVQFDETPLFDELVDGALPRADRGVSTLPGGPGLGIGLSPAVLSRLGIAGFDLTDGH